MKNTGRIGPFFGKALLALKGGRKRDEASPWATP